MKYREHAPYHIRRLEQQMLDTLLRIEDILARAFPEEDNTPAGGPIEDVMTNITPVETPFMKAKAKEPVTDPDGHVVGYVKAKRK
jgi:hypothetical protein